MMIEETEKSNLTDDIQTLDSKNNELSSETQLLLIIYVLHPAADAH